MTFSYKGDTESSLVVKSGLSSEVYPDLDQL